MTSQCGAGHAGQQGPLPTPSGLILSIRRSALLRLRDGRLESIQLTSRTALHVPLPIGAVEIPEPSTRIPSGPTTVATWGRLLITTSHPTMTPAPTQNAKPASDIKFPKLRDRDSSTKGASRSARVKALIATTATARTAPCAPMRRWIAVEARRTSQT